MQEKKSDLSQAGGDIPAILSKHRLLVPYKVFQVKLNWHTIAGEQIAKYSYIQDYHQHTLIVGVLNPVWMQQLFMHKKKIIKNINKYLCEDIITDMRFIRSARKPTVMTYETVTGEDEEPIPAVLLKNIVLSDEDVLTIRKETNSLPEEIKERVAQLRFIQKKRQVAYAISGFLRCPVCGRYHAKGDSLCMICRLKERQEKKKKIHHILQEMPWLTWEEMKQEGYTNSSDALSRELYDEVRRDCIYKYIEKIYNGYDSLDDDLLLAIFITRKKPGELSADFIRNLTDTYRSKEDVSSHRK